MRECDIFQIVIYTSIFKPDYAKCFSDRLVDEAIDKLTDNPRSITTTPGGGGGHSPIYGDRVCQGKGYLSTNLNYVEKGVILDREIEIKSQMSSRVPHS